MKKKRKDITRLEVENPRRQRDGNNEARKAIETRKGKAPIDIARECVT